MIGYLFIILFTVYGQMILKWRIKTLGFVLDNSSILNSVKCVLSILIDPWILSGFLSAFVASLFWIAAMSKFEITYAYPFMSLSPALVFLLGVMLLGESFTIGKLVGLIVIIIGIFITVKF